MKADPAARPRIRGFTLIESLVVASTVSIILSIAMPALQQSRQDARNVDCRNKLKQIALAMHNYHDVFNTFPPGWISRDATGQGHPSTGWQVSILPFVEQAPLYNNLNLVDPVYETAPGDSGARQLKDVLLKKEISVFRCDAEPNSATNPLRGDWGLSNFSGNFGSQPIPRWPGLEGVAAVPTPAKPDGIFGVNSMIRLRDVIDGTSNTILVGEKSVISKAGIWPGPRSNFHESDVVSDGSAASSFNSSETGFSSRHEGGIYFALCDGSVRFIRADLNPIPVTQQQQFIRPGQSSEPRGIFQNLCSRNDGNVVGEF